MRNSGEMPIRVVNVKPSGHVAAHVVPNKGERWYAIKALSRGLGWVGGRMDGKVGGLGVLGHLGIWHYTK